jgi:hypothetical protein
MMYPEDMNAADILEFENEYDQWRSQQEAAETLREEAALARAERDFLDQEEYIRDNDRASSWESWESVLA